MNIGRGERELSIGRDCKAPMSNDHELMSRALKGAIKAQLPKPSDEFSPLP